MSDDRKPLCEFSKYILDYGKMSVLIQHQSHYLRVLETVGVFDETSYPKFRSMQMNLAGLTNARLDFLFEISQPA